MTSGTCLCGNVSISYSGEPALKVKTRRFALCHCTDCQKISGSAYSVNNVVSGEGFKVTGNPKAFTKTADSGKKITSYFCGDCGSTLYRDGENFPGMKIVKAGVLDGKDVLNESKPNVELFAPTRPKWIAALDGAEQKETM
ncbi:hypothetical protein D6C98_10578 [Aureobasidium pullulans]|uniref:CENP-V/GFA domain-containing protein n=1 Tax=Aureobasidium pullulans TaxID=5580 RepID=A0A4S9GQS6_AURPU|nr:hypothetical protein D6D24_02330 [Aureobasidium pullulans]THW51059.1 hypothetical protein D6D22_00935 [Aureobasidium pullulans]THW83494.1 hypothetical protein D6D18_08096 [Aureobasidium pullulans]THX34579.1 hypothetical protein D6D12_00903 [Aureobasidium pullulans]THX64167.1 hypothetical protein D6D11_01339 [Aureobasidium pullulans]